MGPVAVSKRVIDVLADPPGSCGEGTTDVYSAESSAYPSYAR
jgi:hypothetical protein